MHGNTTLLVTELVDRLVDQLVRSGVTGKGHAIYPVLQHLASAWHCKNMCLSLTEGRERRVPSGAVNVGMRTLYGDQAHDIGVARRGI